MGTILKASQHIYAHVEKNESPKGKVGFQTLFCSESDLTQAESSEIEKRLTYHYDESGSRKLIFYRLAPDRIMLSHIVPLAEADRLGRKGRYLAHTLIFDAGEFTRICGNPFLIFKNFNFINSMRQVTEVLEKNKKTATEVWSDVEIHIPERDVGYGIEAAKKWSNDELLEFVSLAFNQDKLLHMQTALAVVGTTDAIEETLEALFALLPADLMPNCCFDTYFHKCNLIHTYYWAIGLAEISNKRKYIAVDAEAHHLQYKQEKRQQSLYEQWLEERLYDDDWEAIVKYKNELYFLWQFLQGKEIELDRFKNAPSIVVDWLFKACKHGVQDRIEQITQKWLEPPLAKRAAAEIYEEKSASPFDLFQKMCIRFDADEVLDSLFDSFAKQNFALPCKDQMNALMRVLNDRVHPFLLVLFACWTKDDNLRQMTFEGMNRDTYRRLLEDFFHHHFPHPLLLLDSSKADIFTDMYVRVEGFKHLPMIELVKELVGSPGQKELLRIAKIVNKETPQGIRKLKRFTEKHEENLPKEFVRAVRDVKVLPPRKPLFLSFLSSKLKNKERET